MTLKELEDRIRRLSSQEASMKIGSYLHATNGFVSRGFKEDFIKKSIMFNENMYYITGSLDDKNEYTIIEAKFITSRRRLKKIRQYAIDQLIFTAGLQDCLKVDYFYKLLMNRKMKMNLI